VLYYQKEYDLIKNGVTELENYTKMQHKISIIDDHDGHVHVGHVESVDHGSSGNWITRLPKEDIFLIRSI
jgi:hypothetical protein